VSARDRGDYARAQSSFERSLDCWRTLSDQSAIARCLHNLANVVKTRGDYARARLALGEATEIFEALDDRSGAAWSINQQGDIAREQGEIAAAQRFYERALAIFRDVGDSWGTARSLTDLGSIDCLKGRSSAAHASYREALQLFAELGHRRGIARALEGFACLALRIGHPRRALTLAAAAAHLRELISAPLPQADQSKVDEALLPAWELLNELERKIAWEAGSAMTTEQAIDYALEEPEAATSP
jgi:tetratricopeptide (TPR) repeat protein